MSLRSNRLRALPSALFRNLSSLEEVQLDHNQLETLPGDAFEALPRLAGVLLGHNPWRCDCGLGPFLAWLRRHAGLVGRAEPPRCHGPGPHAGRLLWTLQAGDLGCPRPESWTRLVAEGQSQDHNLFWGLYFLLLAAQALITGIIVFAMIKLCRLFRKLITELWFEAVRKPCN